MRHRLFSLQRYSGILAVLTLWIGVTVGMHRTGLSLIDKRPISYLGVAHVSQLLFTITLLASAALFLDFCYFISRTFKTNKKFKLFFLIGQFGQMVAALIPNVEGPHKALHTTAAFILAFSLPLFIWQFAHTEAKSHYGHFYLRLMQLELAMFIIGLGLFVFTQGLAPLGEALPAVGFHIWVISLTVISLRRTDKLL